MLVSGTVVDRYTVEHLLGRGGMAQVYCVRHTLLGTRHALKVLYVDEPTVRDRLLREGQLQARLDPAHVVPVTDVVLVHDSPALEIMPLVEGCSLDELLEDHQPTQAEVVALFGSVVAGVASAHGAGVIHRDLKPANVMLEPRRGRIVARVADFGLARPEGSDHIRTHSGQIMGTPAYAAPEQLMDASSVDHRADLWSLGVMLVEMLTGERPFQAQSLARLFHVIQAGTFDDARIPPPWREIVRALLQPDREARLGSATALLTAVSEVVEAATLAVGSPVDQVVRRRMASLRPAAGDAEATRGGVSATIDFAATVPPVESISLALPAERDTFVGRTTDLAELATRLRDGARLVSVLGIGGTGKTRLVVRLAHQQVRQWPGGVLFCDLTEVRDLAGICAAVASAVDSPLGRGDPVNQIISVLSGRGRTLVVLDNFEQVVHLAEQSVGRWVDAIPDAAFVVTSREVLGVPGEQAVPLAPLGPDDSAALFIARAKAAKRGFSPKPTEIEAIDELVAMLDHLPLAIELAAARVRVLSPRKLLERMSDRFRLLSSSGGRRDRQSTLRATLDWSWDLLKPWEQAALAQCAVFEGGFDLEAGESVLDLDTFDDAPWAMDVIQALVDKSLVRTVGDDRFDLLVSVQAYASDRLHDLGGRGAAEARHGTHYAPLGTEDALEALAWEGGVELGQALSRELANVTAACRRAVARGDGDTAVDALCACWWVISQRGPVQTGGELVEAVAALPSLGVGQRARVVLRRGSVSRIMGRSEAALAAFESARDLARQAGDRRLEGHVLGSLSTAQKHSGDRRASRASTAEALRIAREIGDRRSEGIQLLNQAIRSVQDGRVDEAEELYEASLAVHRAIGNRRSEAQTLANLGALHFKQARFEKAQTCYREALGAHRAVGNRRSEAFTLGNLGSLEVLMGRPARARDRFAEALRIHRSIGYRFGQGYWLAYTALLDVQEGDLDAALDKAVEAEHLARGYAAIATAAQVTLARVHIARREIEPARAAIDRARAFGLGGHRSALIEAAAALAAASAGQRAEAEEALQAATADPALCVPGTRVGLLVEEAKAAIEALDAPSAD